MKQDQTKHNLQIKFAYLHSMSFPNNEANAFDAVWTASALAEKVDTTFIVKSKNVSTSGLKKYYYVSDSKLRFQSLYLNLLPDRILLRIKHYYGKNLLLFLRYHPDWAFFHGQKVLYARDPKLLLFLGLQRETKKWLQDWTLIYESHDPLGLDPHEFVGQNPFDMVNGFEGKRRQDILRAAKNFDAIVCNTQALADDLREWSKNILNPSVITLASPLPRLEFPPQINFGEKITLGYIGTIDKLRGVDILLEALRLLPERFCLRVVGRFRIEEGVDPVWLQKLVEDPKINSKLELILTEHIENVLAEIDRCDILIQPASHNILDSRYATPQKTFGYMVRGKPIVAGDVPCHRELFEDEENAILYHLDPQSLADCLINLATQPDRATKIAQGAWEQSVKYKYSRRVNDILSLVSLIS